MVSSRKNNQTCNIHDPGKAYLPIYGSWCKYWNVVNNLDGLGQRGMHETHGRIATVAI